MRASVNAELQWRREAPGVTERRLKDYPNLSELRSPANTDTDRRVLAPVRTRSPWNVVAPVATGPKLRSCPARRTSQTKTAERSRSASDFGAQLVSRWRWTLCQEQ